MTLRMYTQRIDFCILIVLLFVLGFSSFPFVIGGCTGILILLIIGALAIGCIKRGKPYIYHDNIAYIYGKRYELEHLSKGKKHAMI